MAGAGVIPRIRAFLRLAAQDFVELYFQAGINFFKITASVALMMPAPTRRTSGWFVDGMGVVIVFLGLVI